jgi:hypothetical protein
MKFFNYQLQRKEQNVKTLQAEEVQVQPLSAG